MSPPGFGRHRFPFLNPFAFLFSTAVVGATIASTRPPQHFKYYNRNINVVASTNDGNIIEVICPNNASAGVKLEIEYDDRRYYVTVPRGISSGMKFQVKIPIPVAIATEVENKLWDT